MIKWLKSLFCEHKNTETFYWFEDELGFKDLISKEEAKERGIYVWDVAYTDCLDCGKRKIRGFDWVDLTKI